MNTIVRVYERLASEGLLEMRHGEGTFVLPPSTASSGSDELDQQREQFTREFEAVVLRGILLGLTTTQLRSMLTSAASDVRTQIHQQKQAE